MSLANDASRLRHEIDRISENMMTGLDLHDVSMVVYSTMVCAFIRLYLLPRYCRPRSLPEKKYASFDNIAVSFCHSTISGVGSFLSLRNNPALMSYLDSETDQFGCYIAAITTGYFIYDLLDMLSSNGWNPLNMKEMTIHHFCSILVFGRAVVTQQYLGLCMILLKMEINSIFLHARALLQYCQFRGTGYFTIMSILNLITNITHRQIVGIQCFLWGWGYIQQNPGIVNWVTLAASGTICLLNAKLLVTCVKSDFLSSQKKRPKAE